MVKNTFTVFNRQELLHDDKIEIKVSMIYVSILSDLQDICCRNYVECCNQLHEGEKFYMYMKNEFFFPIVLLFNVKKNYLGIQTIQEGRLIPKDKQLVSTGRALGSAKLNEYVSKEIMDILEKYVLEAKEYNPLAVFENVMKIQDHIKAQLLAGDKTFGIYASFNGAENIKDPETTSNVRATLIWNDLFPEDYVAPGDAIYVFDTTLLTVKDVDKIDPKYEDIKEKIKKCVFQAHGNLDFSRFGLKKFAIPAFGDTQTIPEWLIPFISINSMCEKHLQSITSLFSSLLLSPCSYIDEGSNTKKKGISSLIQF